MMIDPLIYQIAGQNFIAEIAINHGIVTAVSKPVRAMAFWHFWKVMGFCELQGWSIEQVKR